VRRSRFLAPVAIAIVAAGAIYLFVSSLGGPNLVALKLPPGAPVITVQRAERGRAIPPGFVGLSLEFTALERYAGQDPQAVNPVLVQLIRNLAPNQAPELRIGGDSTDWTWWPTSSVPRPPGIRYTLGDRWLRVTAALSRAAGAHLVLGIDLEADSGALAAAEANTLVAGIGGASVKALELGNEPELYGTFGWYRAPDGRRATPSRRSRRTSPPSAPRCHGYRSPAPPPAIKVGCVTSISSWRRSRESAS
jgi:hypothetical protein